MPTVPRLRSQVGPRPLPGARLTAEARPETFGAGVAEQVVRGGGLAAEVFGKERADAKRALLTRLEKQALDNERNTLDRDLMRREGEQYLDVYKDFTDARAKFSKNMIDSVDDDAFKPDVERMLLLRDNQYYNRVETGASRNLKVVEDQDYKGVVSESMRSAALAAAEDDPDAFFRVGDEKVRIIDAIKRRYKGKVPASEYSRMIQGVDPMVDEVVLNELIARKNTERARAYLTDEVKKKLPGKVLDGIERKLEIATKTEDSQAFVDSVVSRYQAKFGEVDLRDLHELEQFGRDEIKDKLAGDERERAEAQLEDWVSDRARALSIREEIRIQDIETKVDNEVSSLRQLNDLTTSEVIPNTKDRDRVRNRGLRKLKPRDIPVTAENILSTARASEKIEQGRIGTLLSGEQMQALVATNRDDPLSILGIWADQEKIANSQLADLAEQVREVQDSGGLSIDVPLLKSVVNFIGEDGSKTLDNMEQAGRSLMIREIGAQVRKLGRQPSWDELRIMLGPGMITEDGLTDFEWRGRGKSLDLDDLDIPGDFEARYKRTFPDASDEQLGKAYQRHLNVQVNQLFDQTARAQAAVQQTIEEAEGALPATEQDRHRSWLIRQPNVAALLNGDLPPDKATDRQRFMAAQVQALEETPEMAEKRRRTYVDSEVPDDLLGTFELGKFSVDQSADRWFRKYPTVEELNDSREGRQLADIRPLWREALEQYIMWRAPGETVEEEVDAALSGTEL